MPPIPTNIYHITHIDNLSNILVARGLQCPNILTPSGTSFTNLAHRGIQERRARTSINCGPQGTLHDYVPFYFAPRSPMLYVLSKGNVEDYNQGQGPIIYLVSNAQAIVGAGLNYVFSDGHGIMDFSNFYDDLNDLDNIDWAIMQETIWRDTAQDPDRSRRRQAEFLVHRRFPWNLVTEIGVKNATRALQVRNIISKQTHQPDVVIRDDWYY